MIAIRTYKDHAHRNKKNATIWVLLMDNRRAQLFMKDPVAMEPTLVPVQMVPMEADEPKEYSHPLPRVFQSAGGGSQRHAIEPRHTAQEVARKQLVKDVSHHLHAVEKQYDQLILVAPKKVIGELRATLDGISHKVVAEVEKDLTRAPLRAISLYLTEQHLL